MTWSGATRMLKRLASTIAVAALAVVASAHVGSPNVFFVGKAGAYDVDVVVRPPQVVPGLAEITVRVPVAQGASVRRVIVRPVFWQTGTRGSPTGDVAKRLDAAEPTWGGKLWLMAGGSYSVYVTVDGTLGAGTASIPVAAVAMARLPLGRPLTIVLVLLGLFLVVGMASIVRAAASDGLVPPGQTESPATARRGRLAATIALPVLALAVLGGWKWWDSTARAYERTLYKPLGVKAWVNNSDTARTLTLSITDSGYLSGRVTRILPDHGKLMHLFLVREPELDVFAHLHPSMPDENTFQTALPTSLPAGTYRVYGDIVHESGFGQTLTAKVTLPELAASAVKTEESSGDDAWSIRGERGALVPPRSSVRLSDGTLLTWTSDGNPLVSGRETSLAFDVTDSAGKPVMLDPYLGMAAHAVVMRDDGSVFIHLHPMGTVSNAALQAFSLRERGDTTAKGRLVLGDTARATMPGMAMAQTSAFAIPYAFPKPGHYKLWVQVKRGDHILTGTFDADVAP